MKFYESSCKILIKYDKYFSCFVVNGVVRRASRDGKRHACPLCLSPKDLACYSPSNSNAVVLSHYCWTVQIETGIPHTLLYRKLSNLLLLRDFLDH